MKKTIIIVGVTVLSLLTISVHAQQTTWDAKKNPTVEAIISKYELKPVTPTELKTSDIFPAIGKYESATNPDASAVTINPDEQNKGIVWIDGLPQGRIKAMLRKSPSTYKIPAQKTREGKEVAEGTLIFDKETNTLSICIGKPYNTADPASAFLPQVEPAVTAKTKTKTKKVETPKAWIYTGTKLAQETVMN